MWKADKLPSRKNEIGISFSFYYLSRKPVNYFFCWFAWGSNSTVIEKNQTDPLMTDKAKLGTDAHPHIGILIYNKILSVRRKK